MILAGTGHRPKSFGPLDYSEATRLKLVAFARSQLEKLAPEKVISGMAQGWDQALAEAALSLNVPVVAAVPCDGQDIMWPPASRGRYQALLVRPLVETVVVCPGPYKPYKMQVRNEWMVDRADILLALYNGDGGGTRNCIEYATEKCTHVRVVNAWKEWTDWSAS